jgi:hypothetical protein
MSEFQPLSCGQIYHLPQKIIHPALGGLFLIENRIIFLFTLVVESKIGS